MLKIFNQKLKIMTTKQKVLIAIGMLGKETLSCRLGISLYLLNKKMTNYDSFTLHEINIIENIINE